MMELGLYMASTCFATQIVSINLLNKRTLLFAKLKKNTNARISQGLQIPGCKTEPSKDFSLCIFESLG